MLSFIAFLKANQHIFSRRMRSLIQESTVFFIIHTNVIFLRIGQTTILCNGFILEFISSS